MTLKLVTAVTKSLLFGWESSGQTCLHQLQGNVLAFDLDPSSHETPVSVLFLGQDVDMFALDQARGELFGPGREVLASLGSVNALQTDLHLLQADENGDGVTVGDADAFGGEVLGKKRACNQ